MRWNLAILRGCHWPSSQLRAVADAQGAEGLVELVAGVGTLRPRLSGSLNQVAARPGSAVFSEALAQCELGLGPHELGRMPDRLSEIGQVLSAEDGVTEGERKHRPPRYPFWYGQLYSGVDLNSCHSS